MRIEQKDGRQRVATRLVRRIDSQVDRGRRIDIQTEVEELVPAQNGLGNGLERRRDTRPGIAPTKPRLEIVQTRPSYVNGSRRVER